MRIIPMTLAGAVMVLTFTSAAQQDAISASPAGSSPAVAEVVYLEGSVLIDGAEAEIGQKLGAKATIVTGAAASCEITFRGKNAVRVAQNARATIDFSKTLVEIDLEKGGVASVLRKLETVAGSDSFRVRTQGAVAGVRGTSFCVWADETRSYVCACNGTVHTIDSAGGNEFTITAAHHSARFYTRDGKGITTEEAGLLFHDDAGLESLAGRIGERIDWTVPD
jgi:hypothetical protein